VDVVHRPAAAATAPSGRAAATTTATSSNKLRVCHIAAQRCRTASGAPRTGLATRPHPRRHEIVCREVRGSWCVCARLGFVCARKWGFSGAFRGARVMMTTRCAPAGRLLFRWLLRFEGKGRKAPKRRVHPYIHARVMSPVWCRP
jgi:hypothetical protein